MGHCVLLLLGAARRPMWADSASAVSHDERRQSVRRSLARGAHRRRETEMAAITAAGSPRTGAATSSRARPRAPPTSSRSRARGPPRAPRSRSAMRRDRVRAEPREAAERRLRGAVGHEDLAQRRRVDRDAAADPVAGAERVRARRSAARRATPAGRRDGDVRRLAGRPCRARSRNGQASVAEVGRRSCRGARSRRAPARAGSRRRGRRWARPLRSSARSRRAAVDFGSCVLLDDARSASRSRRARRGARGSAPRGRSPGAPSTIFAMSAALWHSLTSCVKPHTAQACDTICAECRGVAPGSVREDGARHGYATTS